MVSLYGKIHQSFYSSSIIETDVITRYVFMSLIVLSDESGRVDITTKALARRINLSEDEVLRAISELSAPDEMSRSAEHEGRRIVPIDPQRSWGWIVINKAKYRSASDEERRAQAAQRKRDQRERERATGSSDPDPNADTDVTLSHKMSQKGVTGSRKGLEREFERLWQFYPKKLGKHDAKRHFLAQVTSPQTVAEIESAIRNYVRDCESRATEPQFIKHGSTFFNHDWRDYVDGVWQEPVTRKKFDPMRPVV